MIKKVTDYIKKYQMIEADDTIVMGVSGGADSVCLLFILLEIQKRLPFSIEVVHINHGIREDAGDDAEFVKKLCLNNNLPFHLVEEDIPALAAQSGLSDEEEGRKVRYQAFETVLGERKGKIAVAHNSNDRAETMLFHLFRGTGLLGASGIKPVNEKVIRPLLCVSRTEIEEWLNNRNLSFCTDSTNDEDEYTRNKIRHHILAYAQQEICQNAVQNMNRAADQLLEAEDYAARGTALAMYRCVEFEEDKSSLTIDLHHFFLEDSYLQGRILMTCLACIAGSKKDITSEHIKNIRSLFEKPGSRELSLPYGLKVYKKYDLGTIQRSNDSMEEETESVEYEITIPSVMEIPGLGKVELSVFPSKKDGKIPDKAYTKWFDYDKISSALSFRTKKQGDYLTINDKMSRKSLQDYFVNEKIPKEIRNQIYMIADKSHILWIPGYRISEFYKVEKTTKNILQVSVAKDEGSNKNG